LKGRFLEKYMGLLKKGNEQWRMSTNREIKDKLQRTGVVRFIKSLQLRGPKQTVTAVLEGIIRRGRSQESWTVEVE
jgi:hypothetical protein